MCNTAPLLRIDFQAIERHERSDRRQRPDIAEHLKEIERQNAAQMTRGGGKSGMEVANSISGVPQVGNRLPCVVRIRPTLPVHEVLQPPAFVA